LARRGRGLALATFVELAPSPLAHPRQHAADRIAAALRLGRLGELGVGGQRGFSTGSSRRTNAC
jgi:hypothetical protein